MHQRGIQAGAARPGPAACLRGQRQRLAQQVGQRFALLRTTDDTFYLRSGSLNLINGMVGLTFSCDGSHYLPADEFLAKDKSFWFGA